MKNYPEKILVFGATSAIARATLKHFAERKASLFLCARRGDDLDALEKAFLEMGAKRVATCTFDALNRSSIYTALDKALEVYTDLDGVLIAHGVLASQDIENIDPVELEEVIYINYTSIVLILTYLLTHFKKQGFGRIAVLSSVAGDRGRQSNYIYGSTKSALTAFLSGFRQSLHNSGVQVTTINPGLVKTPMTKHLKNNVLMASSESVGRDIYKAMMSGSSVVYVPSYWKWIMRIVKMIPEGIFKKLNL